MKKTRRQIRLDRLRRRRWLYGRLALSLALAGTLSVAGCYEVLRVASAVSSGRGIFKAAPNPEWVTGGTVGDTRSGGP